VLTWFSLIVPGKGIFPLLDSFDRPRLQSGPIGKGIFDGRGGFNISTRQNYGFVYIFWTYGLKLRATARILH